MPPQGNGQVPPVPPVSPAPQSSGQNFSMDSLQKNQKLVATIKTFAIYGTIMYVINAIASIIVSMFHFSVYYNAFSAFAFISTIIVGAITFAIAGLVFYFIYDPIRNWVKRTPFLSRFIHDMFTLFWKPFLVGIIISAIFGLLSMLSVGAAAVSLAGAYGYSAVGFGGLFIGWIISLVVQIGVYYWYAKTVSAKLTPYYPW